MACAQHLLSLAELGEKHSTRLDVDAPQKSAGLTAADAEARLAVYGKNVLTPPKQRPLWLQFLLKARPRARKASAQCRPREVAAPCAPRLRAYPAPDLARAVH